MSEVPLYTISWTPTSEELTEAATWTRYVRVRNPTTADQTDTEMQGYLAHKKLLPPPQATLGP